MFEIYDMTIVPVIIGLVQLCKMVGLKAKYAPFLAVLLGLTFALIYYPISLQDRVLLGLIFGLSASGLYSGSKNLTEKEK